MLQSIFSTQAAAGVGQFFDQTHGQQFGQTLQCAHIGHHANVDFLNTEKRVLRGIANATSRDHVDRTANTAALNGCNHWDAHALQQCEGGLHIGERVVDGRTALCAVCVHGDVAGESFEGHACRKMLASARNDQGPCLASIVQLVQHRIQLTPKCRMHGVERLGLVQHQMCNMVIRRQRKAIEFVHRGWPR